MKDNKEQGFVDSVVKVKRVTKVTKGGKRFSFTAFVVSGDQQGKVGVGFGSSRDVASAIAKATVKARNSMFEVALRGTTVPFNVKGQHGASKVVILSAYKGTGLIAGGAARAVMEALGVKDVLVKSIGPSDCGQNLVKATLNALAQCRSAKRIAQLRGKTIEQITKGCHVGAQ
jgi:small subunit ribosomal protein S5